MNGLFDSAGADQVVNLANVTRITSGPTTPSGLSTYLMYGALNVPIAVFEGEYERLLRRPVQLIPAEPGTSWICAYVDPDRAYCVRTRLIAWALCVDGEVRPVTPYGVCWKGYVELPDGKIEGIDESADPNGFDNARQMSDHFFAEAKAAAEPTS